MENYIIKPSKRIRVANKKIFSTTYGINAQEKEIYVQGAWGTKDSNQLSIADFGSISVKGGGLNNWGIGDLIFKTKAGVEALKWENVSSPDKVKIEVQNYIKKLYNIEQNSKNKTESVQVKPWNEGLTDDDLEDFVVAIPAIPKFYYHYLRSAWEFSSMFHIPVSREDKWIEKGKLLSTLSVRQTKNDGLIMPFSGKYIKYDHITDCYPWDKDTNWVFRGIKRIPEHFEALYIQPLKGENIDNAIFDAYSKLIDFLHNEVMKKLKYRFIISNYKKYLRKLDEEREMIIKADSSPNKIRRDILNKEL